MFPNRHTTAKFQCKQRRSGCITRASTEHTEPRSHSRLRSSACISEVVFLTGTKICPKSYCKWFCNCATRMEQILSIFFRPKNFRYKAVVFEYNFADGKKVLLKKSLLATTTIHMWKDANHGEFMNSSYLGNAFYILSFHEAHTRKYDPV